MPFMRSVSRASIYGRFLLLVFLIFILIIIALGVIHYPLMVKGLLTNTGQSFLSVPEALIHGFASLLTDVVTWIYNEIMDLIVKPIQGVGSTIANGVQNGLHSVGL